MSKHPISELSPRDTRARFRTCKSCARCEGYKPSAQGQDRYACRCCGWVPESTGLTCPHYKERRKHE